MLVGRTGLNQGDIQRKLTGSEQAFDLAQEDGSIVGPAFCYRAPDIPAQEETVMTKVDSYSGRA